ncbi:TrbI/VirB10 family protein [Pseudoduganella aquatica]|uniref:TrbI/VirB10 family protein n=1 Tax=Pseudoduganella aquatica TaxID=2660641 RepID=UPI001E52572B|nr:TrbI/VirB10 family protein [Pseudoduganella aquatica]
MSQSLDMSPDASPGTPTGKSGVRRVNNLPIYILCGLMAAFLAIMALVAADRAEKQRRPPEVKDTNTTSTNMFATELAGQQKDGIIPAAKAAPLVAPDVPIDSPAITVVRPDTLEAPPVPPSTATPSAPQQDQDPRVRIAMEKMHMLEEAIKARTNVQAAAPRSSGSAPAGLQKVDAPLSREEAITRIAAAQQQIDMQNTDDPTAVFQARLQQLQQAGVMGAATASAGGPEQAQAAQGPQPAASHGKSYGQFDGSAQQDRWRLDSQVQAPRSPYELRAGFVLPAILISGINSDLPGQVIGQVSQDVFDTATGKWTLIPQGSRLVGQYSSDIAYGQARVLIAWQRIIFPDGKALDIGAMPGADSAGYAGFHDKVNNHYFRLFGSALLMSGVTAGIALSQPESLYGNRQTARSAMSEALGQQLGHVTAQMIARNMGISPTLEIRPGYRFNVVVTKDLTFSKPYRAFDY